MISFTLADFFALQDPTKPLGSRREAASRMIAEDAGKPRPKPRANRRGEVVLKAVQPNAGIAAAVSRLLVALVDEMETSTLHWLEAAYKRAPPAIAQDELSSAAMRAAIRKLAVQWRRRFGQMAWRVKRYFDQAIPDRVDAQLMKIMKDAGWTVEFNMTQAQRDVVGAIVHENVSLIRSIPAQHFAKVEGVVMRSVAAGYNLKTLREDLQAEFGVTKKRAQFIASDQCRKATAMLGRARQVELGVRECVWIHSHAGRTPRPNHVKFGVDKARYDPAKGLWDPDADGKGKGRFVIPSQLINCRCLSRPILPSIGRSDSSDLTVSPDASGIQRVRRA